MLQGEAGVRMNSMASELAEAKNAVNKLEEDVKEHDRMISQTRQFQDMKKILAKKNKELISLRKRLERYEPDDAEIADDD